MSTGSLEDQIRRKMKQRNLSSAAIEGFIRLVARLRQEKSAYTPLEGVSVPDSDRLTNLSHDSEERLELDRIGADLMPRVVVIKLNGGRSTTMGGEVPKGILKAKDGLSYLEIIGSQMEGLHRKWNVEIPLALMNSFFTHNPTLEIVRQFPFTTLTFVQDQVPRLLEDTLEPLDSGTDEDWAPPGHGNVYDSLYRSGLLKEFLDKGIRWAFISNLDNLAAMVEPWILGLMDRDSIDFLLEVTDRTEADKKGGTLVVRDERLELLEIAQVAPEDQDSFMDIDRFRVFNTNNVWVDLEALWDRLEAGVLDLPIIQNRKLVADRWVLQIETAMGSAVGSFQRAAGLRVGRDRFFPTKKVEDLFLLQSDVCVLDSEYRLQPNPNRPTHLTLRPSINFESDFLDTPLRMDTRFENPRAVSLLRAASLRVSGNVFFESDIAIEGDVEIRGPASEAMRIDQGSVLKDTVIESE